MCYYVNEDPRMAPISPLSCDTITIEYRDFFQGLGCLPAEFHLKIDKTMLPVQHQHGAE